MNYQLELKQLVDYPRCRIYREFIHNLIEDKNIRTSGGSYLFYYITLCAYANYRKSNRIRYLLLEITALCGEFPAEQLHRLIPSPSYSEKVITSLKADKFLRTHYRDKLRGYRLTKKSKVLLLETNPSRFCFYLTGNSETNQIRSEPMRRLRLYQKAEAYLTLYHAGISLFPDEKPPLFTAKPPETFMDMRSLPYFYTSREIKQLGTVTTKFKNSRRVSVCK